jgi:hypothetical protein
MENLTNRTKRLAFMDQVCIIYHSELIGEGSLLCLESTIVSFTRVNWGRGVYYDCVCTELLYFCCSAVGASSGKKLGLALKDV